MAVVGHVDARDLAKDLVDQAELNKEIQASLAKATADLKVIQDDYVTSKNVGEKFRGSLPKFWDRNEVNYNDLPFGDHLLWDFATGITNAPPVPTAQWMFVEMIRTYPYPPSSPLADNAVQRAWGYDKGFMATRSRYQGRWSKWTVMEATVDTRPDLPEVPTE